MVEVPALGPLATVPPVAPVGPSEAVAPSVRPRDEPADRLVEAGGTSRAAAWTLVLGGSAIGLAGGALIVVEAIRAGDARAQHDVSFDYGTAQTLWTSGLVGAIVGGGCAATGFLLLATGRDSATASTEVRLSPWVGARDAGVRLGRNFKALGRRRPLAEIAADRGAATSGSGSCEALTGGL